MTFEEWFDKEGGYDGSFDTYESAAEAAWDAAVEEAHKAGMDTLVKAHQIRPRGKSMLAYLPEGYVLVPVEPTEKMVEAAYKIDMEVKYDSRGNYLHSESTSVRRYKAMIQAAQEEE